MAIVRGNTQTAVSSAATSLAVNKPTGLVNGDVLVTTCGNSATTAVVPTGFTSIGRVATTASEEVIVAYKVVTDAASEPATYTWTSTSGRTTVAISAYSGVDTTTPIDVTPFTDTGTGSVDLFVTPATNGAMIYAAAVGDWSTDGMTVHTSLSTIFNLGNPGRRTAAGDLIQAVAGSNGTDYNFLGQGAGATLPMAGIIFALRQQTLTGGSATGSVTWAGSATGDNGATTGSVTGSVTWSGTAKGSNDPGPDNLVATAVSATQINLTWNPGTGVVSGYDIERNGVVIVSDHLTTSYSDTGLTPNTTYTYRVRTVR